MTDEVWMPEPVELPSKPKRKRRKYRRYPRPVCTPEQKKGLWEYQNGL